MFGRQPRVLIDLCFDIDPAGHNHKTQKYVQVLCQRLKHAYKCAMEETERLQSANKGGIVASMEGDRLLIRNVNLCGKQKLANRWEPKVHIVVRQIGEDLPVYMVHPEDDDSGPESSVHRDLLQPCGFISSQADDAKVAPAQPERMSTRQSANEESKDEFTHLTGSKDSIFPQTLSGADTMESPNE